VGEGFQHVERSFEMFPSWWHEVDSRYPVPDTIIGKGAHTWPRQAKLRDLDEIAGYNILSSGLSEGASPSDIDQDDRTGHLERAREGSREFSNRAGFGVIAHGES